MILRRLADAIREQNWFTVVLEVLIVVVGIFIGLQVDDWSKARLDRKDEQIFLKRIHDELLDSVNVRTFIREQRLKDWSTMDAALDVVFEKNKKESLTLQECEAINRSSYLTANIGVIPSFEALLSTGRIGIIRDKELNSSLVRFEQRRQSLLNFASNLAVELGSKYPHLIQLTPVTEPNGNVESRPICDLAAMRSDQAFLNDLAINVDKYEAYISSGLKPAIEGIAPLHNLLDKSLEITHDEDPIQ